MSILIITYNHEKHIEKAIESVRMQKFFYDYEIIVADDSSTDNTVNIVSRYKAIFGDKLKIFSNPQNLGITKNYKSAFSKCSGDFIAVLEGDDYWSSDMKLKLQMDFLINHPECSMVFNKIIAAFPNNLNIPIQQFPDNVMYLLFNTSDLVKNNFIQNFSGCMYRASVIRNIDNSLYDMLVYDWMINIVVSQYGLIGYLPQSASVHPILDSGTWSGRSEFEQLNTTLNCIDKYNSFLGYKYNKEFIENKSKICRRINEIKIKAI
ncbi:glycosyltransferase [Clostridium sp. DMHC 10]|uniref:glycosyltransferase n=1 Tax=Clostridium sp. DMHC 10 TaxID=747377 RepID=UPI001FA75DDD|nr:glycosyltransferase [Clostridium sp. DMHC 10]